MPLTMETIETQLVASQPQWGKTLPAVLPPDKFLALALLCVRQTPRLAECSEASILAGIFQAARDGLELGPDAYLIPFRQRDGSYEATYVKSYPGIIKQLMRAGAKKAFAEVVYEFDHCQIDYGNIEQPLIHTIDFTKSRRGKALGAYGAIVLASGVLHVHYMHQDDIDDVRKHAPGKDAAAWKDRPYEMWRKTALRNAAKYVALLDDEPEGDDAAAPPDPADAAKTVTMFSRSATPEASAQVLPTAEGRQQMADMNAQRQEALKPYRLFLDHWRAQLTSDQLNAIATQVTGNYCALLPTTPLATLLAGHEDLGRWHAWLEAQEPALLEQASAPALVEAFMTREEVPHAQP